MEIILIIFIGLFVWAMYNWRQEINKRKKAEENETKWFKNYTHVVNLLTNAERRVGKHKAENTSLRAELDTYKTK